MMMKTTSRLEGSLQRQISRWLKTRPDIWSFNVNGSPVQEGGVSDYLLCKNGWFISVELKRPDGKGKPTERQLAQLARVRRAGGIGVVVDDFDMFIQLMNKY